MDIFKEDYLGMENKAVRQQRKRGGVDPDGDLGFNKRESYSKMDKEAQERGLLSELPAGERAEDKLPLTEDVKPGLRQRANTSADLVR